jgi:hypothetical protein
MKAPDTSGASPYEASSRTALDDAVRTLRTSAPPWARLPATDRVALLDRVQQDLDSVADGWVRAGAAARGVAGFPAALAEEWLFFAVVRRAVRLLRDTIERSRMQGADTPAVPARRLADGRSVLRVAPQSRLDRAVYRGLTGEVVLTAGAAAATTTENRDGELALVLGAGNAPMLPVVDTLHQLFVERRVVMLKLNPVNDYLGVLVERGLAALVDGGYLRVVHGGTTEGTYLTSHPSVDAVHLTGSRDSYDAIIATLDARSAGTPPIPVTAELGNVSPVIVVPGPWTAAAVRRQAERVATWLVANAGFGCLTPRVLITHREWPLRHRFLADLRDVLAAVPTRPAYYPGAPERFAAFVQAHPDAWLVGDGNGDRLPWALVHDVDPAAANDICFRREAFCGLISETSLAAPSAAAFVERAAEFANQTLWGTLVATVLVDPVSAADARTGPAVEQALLDLRYGTVTVNSAAFAAYYLQTLPWGAAPADGARDTDSGVGRTANALMLRGVEKSILRGPFRTRIEPLRATARRPDRFARQLALFEAAPSVRRLPGIVAGTARSQAFRSRLPGAGLSPHDPDGGKGTS